MQLPLCLEIRSMWLLPAGSEVPMVVVDAFDWKAASVLVQH